MRRLPSVDTFFRAAVLSLALTGCAAEAPERRPPASVSPPVAVPIPAPESTAPVPRSTGPACDEATDASFESVWPRLRAHLEAGLEGLTPLVDPKSGVFVIDNPGAFVVPMHFDSIAAAGERVPKLTVEHYRLRCPEARSDATPQFSCETEEWSPSGCVITSPPQFSVARWYELAIQYEIIPLSEANEGLERARQTDPAISHGVYSTQDELGFYFGRVGCSWRLLAINTVIPCSA